MVLFVAGFPTKVAGLKFEYMWTYPLQSRYVDTFKADLHDPRVFSTAVQVLVALLSNKPYSLQPLTVNFMDFPLFCQFESGLKAQIAPNIKLQMNADYEFEKGVDVGVDIGDLFKGKQTVKALCIACGKHVDRDFVRCDSCETPFCFLCCAFSLAKADALFPSEGCCGKCGARMRWADVLRAKTAALARERGVTNGSDDGED